MCRCDGQMGQITASELGFEYMVDPFPIFEPAPAPVRDSPLAESPVRPVRRELILRPDVVLPTYFEESEPSKALGIVPIAVIGLILLAVFKGGR